MDNKETGKMAIDVVCGMEIDRSEARHVVKHKNEDYFFCSTNCRDHFVVDPEKYVG